ncbi:MAG: hypothetical protein MJ192_10510 [Clostridia bacterium]|nr:hypothetical protein [Clostridia bacterium]
MRNRITILWAVTFLLLACLAILCGCGQPDTETPVDSDVPIEASEPETEPVTQAPTEPETEAETEYEPVAPYYVCLHTGDIENDVIGTYESLKVAQTTCIRRAQFGYRVCDSNGVFVWGPYTELQCDLLREGKWVADYVRVNKFKYGDAPINPGIDSSAKRVSCDRLVCWIYYRVGFTDQPRVQGLTIHTFFPWCERMGFEKITRVEDLQPGDIVGVRRNGSIPEHVFMYAGMSRYADTPAPNKNTYRYDGGSDYFINLVQPVTAPMSDFMVAYRPVFHTGTIQEVGEDEVHELTLSQACGFLTGLKDVNWNEPDEEISYTHDLVIDGKAYRVASVSGTVLDVETGLAVKTGRDFRTLLRELLRDLAAAPSV